MRDIKIILKSDISMKDTKLDFEEDITLEQAGYIIQYVAEQIKREKLKHPTTN